MKYIFLLNQFSLKYKTNEMYEKIKRVCKKKKLNYKIEVNSPVISTEDILEKYKNTRNIIIAIGGDGTINRVLNGIVNTNNILGYIPYGTGNDFYRTNKELLNKGINKIDLVKINNKYFINIACFGIDADIGNNERIIHNKFIPRRYRYKIGVISSFIKYKPKLFEIDINNKTIKKHFTTVVVCNARYYGGGYKVSPNSSLTDGLLEVVLATKTNKYNMAKMITSMKTAMHLYYPEISIVQTKKLVLKSPTIISANVDGEELRSKKFEIEIIEKGVEVYYDQDLINQIINKEL